jgi:hypothetical protein
MWSMQWSLEFEHQLSIFCGTKDNHGNPWSSLPFSGPSKCKLTSSQQSGIKYASHNTSPYLSSPLWDLRPDTTSCRNVVVWNLWSYFCGAPCLQFAVQLLNGPSRAEHVTIFYCLIWDSPQLGGRGSQIPPGTRWPSYTTCHLVPFPSPPTTRRASVDVF